MSLAFGPALVIGLCLGLATGRSLSAQDGPPHPDRTPEHAHLDGFAGEWAVTGSFNVGSTEPQPIDLKGSETARWMPGNLWLDIESQGNVGGALPFVGRSLLGYDVGKKKFVHTGVTSLSPPRLTIAEGLFDPSTRTLTIFDTVYEVGGRTPSEVKIERTLRGDDTQVVLGFTKRSGEWVKSFEMNYTRKKK